jgi:hypothetical protein
MLSNCINQMPEHWSISMSDEWRPNWLNGSYPDPNDKTISSKEWAWEFLRRNQQYAQDCIQCAMQEESPEAWFKKHNRLRHQYMVINMYPPDTLFEHVRFADYVNEYDSFDEEWPKPESESVSEVIIKFHFDWSVERQLERVNRFLKTKRQDLQQRELIDLQPDSCIRTGNYRKHLRLLDGLHQGETLYQLGKILSPGSNSKDRKDLKDEAQALSQWKYKRLLYTSVS